LTKRVSLRRQLNSFDVTNLVVGSIIGADIYVAAALGAKLVGPADLFGDPAYDRTRQVANEITDYMRRHGPFMPHRLGPEEMEYTTLPEVLRKLNSRFKKEKLAAA